MKISMYLDTESVDDVHALWVLANSTAKKRLSKKQFIELLEKMLKEAKGND